MLTISLDMCNVLENKIFLEFPILIVTPSEVANNEVGKVHFLYEDNVNCIEIF